MKSEAKESEDWCFECKDGGELVVCDREDCAKVYHADCVDSFSESGESWICGCHSCYNCDKSPKFYCLGCPKAVCKKCYVTSEFAIVKGEKGLCEECRDLVLIIEKNLEMEDSEGKIITWTDRETYEGLFKEYWDVIKEKEGLTSVDVCAALTKTKKGKSYVHHRRFSESDEDEDEDEDEVEDEVIDLTSDNSDTDDTSDREPVTKRCKRSNLTSDTCDTRKSVTKKCNRSNLTSDTCDTRKSVTKKWKGSKSQEFKGWGSECLISFLTSIGKDVSEPLTQWDVSDIIYGYVLEKKLFLPKEKGKMGKFIPDEKLIPIFRKQVVSETRIYSLLETHFAEGKNDDDKKESSPKKCPSDATCLERRPSSLKNKPSCFAAISVDNIKPVYLKQSLVEELSKQPESFENKVIGAFVKVRAYPDDRKQRNYHQLVRVTGVNGEFHLKVSFMPNAIPISELSEEDLKEQECEALRQSVKDGLLQKLTKVELQEKANSLHEDITKHWIAKRLDYLQRRIEYTNDKGWHREKDRCIDEKLDLAQPGKQERLLQQVPSIIPEDYWQRD